jgi:hypothetical protein
MAFKVACRPVPQLHISICLRLPLPDFWSRTGPAALNVDGSSRVSAQVSSHFHRGTPASIAADYAACVITVPAVEVDCDSPISGRHEQWRKILLEHRARSRDADLQPRLDPISCMQTPRQLVRRYLEYHKPICSSVDSIVRSCCACKEFVSDCGPVSHNQYNERQSDPRYVG